MVRNDNSTGSVNFSVEELEEMSLEVTHNEGIQAHNFHTW